MRRRWYISLGLLIAMSGCNKTQNSGSADIVETEEGRASTSITSRAPDGSINIGQTYTYNVEFTKADPGGEYTCRLENQPTGMVIDSSTCVVTWSQTTAGSFSPSVIVENINDTTDQVIQNFGVNVGNVGTTDTGVNNGSSTNQSSGDIQLTSTPPQSWNQGDYNYTLTYSGSPSATYICELQQVENDPLPPGLEFNAADCSVQSNQVMPAGTYKFRMVVTNQSDSSEFAIQEIWLQVPTTSSTGLTITSTPPSSLSQNNQYVYQVTYQSNDTSAQYSCSLEQHSEYSMPPQITIDSSSCLIQINGTLTTGSYGYRVRVTNTQDSTDSVAQENAITLGNSTGNSTVNITSQPPTSWPAGNYSYQLAFSGAEGEQYTCRIDPVEGYALPAGLTLNEQGCSVASTATMTAGTYKYRFVVVNVNDSQDSTYQELSIVVASRVTITSQPPQVTSVANYVYAVQYQGASADATYACSIQPVSGRTFPPSIAVGAESCVVSIAQDLTQGQFGYEVVVTNTQDSNDFQSQVNFINVN